eukprot:Rhum_TRINITY_DN14920_c10_g2::Rhum_TRINITY_DN14920_c10_g2_i1::g.127637::m.127637/K14792/RRP5, PDCD11; rRNA biogenesis protein RRP5
MPGKLVAGKKGGGSKRKATALVKDDSSEEEAKRAKLQAWEDEHEALDDEGSSDDEVENQKDTIKKRGVMGSAPISKVLCKKVGKNGPSTVLAYAVIVDLGGGVDGFVPISELAESDDAKEALASRLSSMKPAAAPEPGKPDRRNRLHHLVPLGAGNTKNQLLLSARGEKVCSALSETWTGLPAHCLRMLQHLYDRDRVGELTSNSGLHVGLLLEGSTSQRTKDGLVLELTNPCSHRHRNLIGVAVGANAQEPQEGDNKKAAPGYAGQKGTPVVAPGTPGTPGSQASTYDLRKFRAQALRCRILDFDLASGVVDTACCPSVVNCPAGQDPNASLSAHRTLKKKLGKNILCQVVLKKKDYAVVISRPNSGVLGYMPFRNEAEAARVKSGDKISGKIEYVRVKPVVNQMAKKRGQPERGHWTQTGRRMQDDDEASSAPGTPSKAPGTPGSVASSSSNKYRRGAAPVDPTAPPLDAWLCRESFLVLSYVVPPKTTDADGLPIAAATTTTPAAPAAGEASGAAATLASLARAAPAKKASPIEVGFFDESSDEASDDEEGVDESDDDSDSDAAATDKATDKKKKKKKKKKANAEDVNELMVDQVERRRLGDTEPKSVDDFERLVMASPHSSYVWCQYMAYYVGQRELEQARLIAERALKRIDYRESEELFNVWVAYMNVENLHGTPESLNTVFQRCVQHSDQPEKAYNALIQIGKASNHTVLVEKTYQMTLKKFGKDSIKPWVEYIEYLIQKGSQDDLQKLQKRILNNHALSDKQHVEILIKTGCLQYRQGSIDKGRTVFEGLIVKYPKRTDIWSVYLDMELVVLPRLSDPTRIRNVYDRITSVNLSSKKMQYFLTRYMGFEKDHGTPERVAYVKQRAVDFVNAKLGDDDAEE